MSFRRAAGPEEPAFARAANTPAARKLVVSMIIELPAILRSVQYNFGMPKHSSARGHATKSYPLKKNFCFACGQDNPDGMRLKFTLDEKRQTFVCRFRLSKRYTGPPGHCHGGIIATILDDAMGKVNKLRHVIALTKEMTIEYLKPVPLHKPLRVEGREVSVHGRRHINMAEIMNEKGEVLARGRGTFIAIDPEKLFAKFVER